MNGHWILGWILLRGFLISIINTTFIELSTTAYLFCLFFPHLILRLYLLYTFTRAAKIKSPPKPVANVKKD